MSEQDGDERTPEGEPPASEETRPVRPATYGTPSSPSYGKWGSGQADWATPEQPSPESPENTWAMPPTPPTTAFGGNNWTSPPPPPGYGPPNQHGAPGQYGPPSQYGQYGPPGQYGAPGQYGWSPPAARLRRTRGLAVAVIVVSGLVAALMWVSAFLAPKGSFLYSVNSRSIQQFPDPLLRYLSIEIYGVGLLMLIAWVLTSIWLSQVRENALAFDPAGQRRSAVWAWLGWIVPIVAFWYPKQILDDALNATAKAAGRPRTIRTAFFWAAWVVWFLQFLIVRPITWHVAGTDDVGAVQQVLFTVRPGAQVVAAVVATITFGLWALLVHQVSAAQDELVGPASGFGAPGSGPGTGFGGPGGF